MKQSSIPCLSLLLAAAVCTAADDRLAADKAALAPLQQFVGSWRGVGQPRRGSSQGAWTETADWAWKFAEGRAALVFDSPKGKYYRSGKLAPGEAKGQFELTLKRVDASGDDHFSGSRDAGGQLVLLADKKERAGADMPSRVTIHTVAGGDRLLVLYEKRSGAADRYVRLAEVGYTRVGIAFAKGSGEPECVVTGGLGTIAVEHRGKTYYVCCTGCRDLFNDDPEGVLAEYRQRKAAGK
ncbi:MAG: hypothetical protein B7Z73_07070 [Planctomycetia bacterium 21-64-5]|nr:MAG: hypothetical protein B7Z73_07070 [Planctomycetia bacterium 21-64-5]HQU44810.1 hypothetical protein [Pirellulales bacterium]